MASQLKCSRGHALVRFEVHGCDGGHDHLVYVCPMRLGSKACGDVTVLPPFTGACAEDDEAE